MRCRYPYLLLLAPLLAACHLLFPYEGKPDGEAPRHAEAGDVAASDGPDLLIAPDLAPPDLAPPEMALPDLAPPEMALPDLMQPDLMPPPDLAPPPDQLLAKDGGCPAGMTRCGGVCALLKSSTQHCGKCFAPCDLKQANVCQGGQCSCSKEGHACGNGLNCVAGSCVCVAGGLCGGCCDGPQSCLAPAFQTAAKCGLGINCKPCDDNDPCTKDSCVAGKCLNAPLQPGDPCIGESGRCDENLVCCNGCLTGNHSCQKGDQLTLCGKAGAKCVSCKDTKSCNTDSCSAGACKHVDKKPGDVCDGVAGRCASDLQCCTGCLTSAKLCKAGSQLTLCGKAGATCISCKDTNSCTTDSCSAGACKHVNKTPGDVCDGVAGRCASDHQCCTGCLTAAKVCKKGFGTSNCGLNGQTCKACTTNKACRKALCTSKRICGEQVTGGVACSGGICAADGACCNGCLKGGKCYKGTSNSLCGVKGAACGSCSTSKPCKTASCATGTCVEKVASNGASCSGGTCYNGTCCDGCVSGGCVAVASQSKAKCGHGGASCATCGYGLVCLGGACVCSPAGDCKGCCSVDGKQCKAGTTTTACGAAGSYCTDCTSRWGSGAVCDSGHCYGSNTVKCYNCPAGQCCDSVGKCHAPSDQYCPSGNNSSTLLPHCEDCTARASSECTMSQNCFNSGLGKACVLMSKSNGTICSKGYCCYGACVPSKTCKL